MLSVASILSDLATDDAARRHSSRRMTGVGPALPPDPASHPPSDSQRAVPRPARKSRPNTSCARELSVSRVTLREALRELVRENLLVKIQGKGTFVALDPPKRLAPVSYTGFLEELQERVRKLTVTDVEIAQVPATAELQAALHLDAGDAGVTPIKRLRHIDDEPFSFTVNYLPTEIGTRIRAKDLYSVPLLQILQEDLKIPIVRARETIEAAPADPEVAQQLGIPVLYPVMHMTRVMYTTGDRAVRAGRHLLPGRQISLFRQPGPRETQGQVDLDDRSRNLGVATPVRKRTSRTA